MAVCAGGGRAGLLAGRPRHTGTRVPLQGVASAGSRPVREGVAGSCGPGGEQGRQELKGVLGERQGTAIVAEIDDLPFGLRAVGTPFCLLACHVAEVLAAF